MLPRKRNEEADSETGEEPNYALYTGEQRLEIDLESELAKQ
jgi:hypothetical protein